MAVAALVAWVLAAGGGFVMVARWVSAGGLRQQGGGATRFPAALVFGHAALAAAGLVLWILYLALDAEQLPWVAFVLLVLVALGGFTLFARWLPSRRAATVPAGVGAGRPGRGGEVGTAGTGGEPAERHVPVPVVAAHGLFAVVTLVLVLLTALGVGG
jgi:hypothetical protein